MSSYDRGMVVQTRLFGGRAPAIDPTLSGLRRHDLGDGAWLDHRAGWVRGDDTLFDHLVATTAWREEERPMYDRVVSVPRLLGALPADGPGHPVLVEAAEVLSRRYDRAVRRITMALYRDGGDSVAFHADRVGERIDDSIVAIVSLRGPRRLRVRRKDGTGPNLPFDLGHGDLLVMGGTCQRHCEHGVPKVASAPPRLSLMFRDGD